MAYSYTWPGSLPQAVRPDYTSGGGVLVARTPMDQGPAKQRYVGAMPKPMGVSFEMTTAQVATLDTFIESTIKGTARFGFPHPRTGAIVEARIVPQGEGRFYTESYLSPGYWLIALQLEVLP